MRFTKCPKCDERLKAPDNSEGQAYRCPTCKHTFKINPPSASIAVPACCEPSAAGGNGDADGYISDAGSLAENHRILLDADEAMLRDFGNEMIFSSPPSTPSPVSAQPQTPLPPREDISSQVKEDRLHGTADAPQPSPMMEGQGRYTAAQFQNIGAALPMAERLIDVYKAELARMRRISLTAWLVVAVVSAGAAGVFWWGMTMSGQIGIERATVASLTRQQADTGKTIDKNSQELQALRDDLSKVQAEVSQARETAGKNFSAVQTLTASLEAVNARLSVAASQPVSKPIPMADATPSQ